MTRVDADIMSWALREGAACTPDQLIEPLAATPGDRREYLYLGTKRAIDLALGLLLMALLMPVMLAAAVAIKCTSRGPILFRQKRAGLRGKPFVMYKFRSMMAGADRQRPDLDARNEADGPVFKLRRDPRLTRVGRFLRRTSIDELPQLFNVLRGEMSLVGPRPLPLDEVRMDSLGERYRLNVPPGLTCLWQISGRCELPYHEWMQLDLLYVQHRGLLFDLDILLKTIPAVLSCRGAY